MTEPKKIRFTKDCIFGIKAGDEYEVDLQETPEARIKIPHLNNKRQPIWVYLDEIMGWYEVVKWRPGLNERYFKVTSVMSVEMCVRHGMVAACERGIDIGNCYPTRDQAEAKAEQMRQIFKGEIC